MVLKEIAQVKMGLVLGRKSAKSKRETVQKYRILTLRSIRSDRTVNMDALEEFKSTEILNENNITQNGDVVIRLTEPNTAVFIDESLEGLVITNHFCVIRVISDVIPEYLAWYLNSDPAKRQMQKGFVGTAMPTLKTSTLNDIDIDIVPIEIQYKIVEIDKLYYREMSLLNQLMIEKEKLYTFVAKELLNIHKQ